MKNNKNVNVVSCPPCGERACPRGLLSGVAVATKRGAYKAFSLMSPSIGPADHFLRKGGRKGFTLIELLVVVLIIGILTAVAVPQYQVAVLKSRAMEGLVGLDAWRKAQQSYYLANGEYIYSWEGLDIDIPNKDKYIFEEDFKKISYTLNSSLRLSFYPLTNRYLCQAITTKYLENKVCATLSDGNPKENPNGWTYYDMPSSYSEQ